MVLILEGRADGIWTDEDVTVVDEIKGTYRNIWQMECPERVHLAQAKCYAYVYALQNHLPRIRTRMVYADLETEELRFFTEEYEWEVLKDWFSDLVERYHKWLSFQSEWKEHRETDLEKMLQFPYPYREGQKDLGSKRVSEYFAEEAAFHSGTHRSWQDLIYPVSGTESRGGRTGG